MTLLIWFEIFIPAFAIFAILAIKPELVFWLRKKIDSAHNETSLLSEDLYNEKGKEVLRNRIYEAKISVRIGAIMTISVLVVANIVCVPKLIQERNEPDDAWELWVTPCNDESGGWSTGIVSGHSDAVEDITKLERELRQLEFAKEDTCEHEAEYKLAFSNGNKYYVKLECGGVCVEKYGRVRQAQMTAEIEALLAQFGVR